MQNTFRWPWLILYINLHSSTEWSRMSKGGKSLPLKKINKQWNFCTCATFLKNLKEQSFLLLRPQCTVLFLLFNVEVYPEKLLDSWKCAKNLQTVHRGWWKLTLETNKKTMKFLYLCNSGVLSTGAMGTLAPAILGQSINVTSLWHLQFWENLLLSAPAIQKS